MVWEIIIGILVSIAIIFLIFVAYIAYRMAKPPREVGEWTPKDYGMNYENFEVENEEGLKLKGWYVNKNSEKTVFLLHGYTVSRWTFYIEKMVKFLAEKNYNLVVFDFRAHGESEGKYTTVGDREINDLKAVVEKFATNKNCVVGYSMGGIIAIRSLTLPEISCAIADSPPIYMDRTGKRGLKYFANLPEWLYWFAKPFFTMLTKSRGIEVMKYADVIKKPLLIIAGKNDPLVNVDEVQEFYYKNKKINENVDLWVTEGAHVRTVKVDEEGYKNRVLEFIEKYTG